MRLAYGARRASMPGPLAVALASGAWLGVLSVVSTIWSIDPRVSFERAVSLTVLLVAAACLALAARERPALPSRLMFGMLLGTAAASIGGVVLFFVARSYAVQAASVVAPARLQGLGLNPDTMAMLQGVVFPVSVWAVVRAARWRDRIAAIAVAALLLGSISASGSRGGLLGAGVGAVVLALCYPGRLRTRALLLSAVIVAVGAAALGTQIPRPLPAAAVKATLPHAGQGVGNAEPSYTGPLSIELYRVYPGARSFFHASGRLEAWYTAIRRANSRPVVGFGFGTETQAFINRIYDFHGEYVENSYIGLYLQLGAIGILSFLLFLCAAGWGFARSLRTGSAAVPLAAVVCAGLAVMFVQSYVYSVGNVATTTFWIAAFVGIAGRSRTIPLWESASRSSTTEWGTCARSRMRSRAWAARRPS